MLSLSLAGEQLVILEYCTRSLGDKSGSALLDGSRDKPPQTLLKLQRMTENRSGSIAVCCRSCAKGWKSHEERGFHGSTNISDYGISGMNRVGGFPEHSTLNSKPAI